MMDQPTCAWGVVRMGDIAVVSQNCDRVHPVETYLVKPRGQQVASRTQLCRFHGQYWPKEGETELEAKRRTASARARIANRTGPTNDAQRLAGWGRSSRPTEDAAEV